MRNYSDTKGPEKKANGFTADTTADFDAKTSEAAQAHASISVEDEPKKQTWVSASP